MALPDGMSSCAMCVEIMTGTTWVDVSDFVSIIEPPTQTRPTGVGYVFGEDTGVTAVGKREPVEVTARGVWAIGTTHLFYTVYAEFTAACGDLVAIRWAPAGCTTTADAFYTSTTKSEVISLTPPGGDAASADILMYEFIVYSPDFTRATYT